MLGHGAELAFRKVFGGDRESAVKASASVFPGDDSGEFDELRLGEMSAKSGVEFVGNI